MNITQEQLDAIAQSILSEYQEAVDKKLCTSLSDEAFCNFTYLQYLSNIYQTHYGQLLGIFRLLNAVSSFEQADYIWSITDQLLEQYKLNNRTLSDIACSKLHAECPEVTVNNQSSEKFAPTPFNGKPITDVEIRAVVPYEDRPSLIPVRGTFINVADCKAHTDWLINERGDVIPLKDKPCLVERVAKNGSFYACGRWFRRCIASVYVNSDVFGTRLVYI